VATAAADLDLMNVSDDEKIFGTVQRGDERYWNSYSTYYTKWDM
jgi:hypothetical protein